MFRLDFKARKARKIAKVGVYRFTEQANLVADGAEHAHDLREDLVVSLGELDHLSLLMWLDEQRDRVRGGIPHFTQRLIQCFFVVTQLPRVHVHEGTQLLQLVVSHEFCELW
jgi:hypothetical protein